ncbi:uncharacterized protein LOC132270774 [Cornus florida]|uniref:uncharacterized protein LOC132270774 n=1 Tax=Cornus florida TaxID=4283 RepID=UPI00289FDB2B|nr:uncharacterized protein LOC132270774 [Cornus florida]
MVVKVALKKGNAHVICLQESKLASISDYVVRSLWGSRFVDWEALNAYDDNFSWVFFGVYGPVIDCDRPAFWQELSYIKDLWSLPWCLGGDFNSVRSPFERSTGGRWSSEMTQFSYFIDGNLLIDLPLEGATFTWSSGRDPEEKFPDVTQSALVRVTSDHVPLVLDCGGMRSRRTPFRFENMWLRVEDFQEKVQSWWETTTFTGFTSYVLAKKFQILKSELKKWNKEVFGNLEWKKNRVLTDIAELDRLDEIGQDTDSLRSRRAFC